MHRGTAGSDPFSPVLRLTGSLHSPPSPADADRQITICHHGVAPGPSVLATGHRPATRAAGLYTTPTRGRPTAPQTLCAAAHVPPRHAWLQGRPPWRSVRAAPFIIATDASLDGFGFYLESLSSDPSRVDSALWPRELRPGHGYSGLYSHEDAALHATSSQMTWCELFAVYAALSTYRSALRDCCVLFRVDNQTDVAILCRQRTRSRRLAPLLREIYSIAVDRNLDLWAVHRAGVDNVLADFLSRPVLHGGGNGAAITRTWTKTHPSLSDALHFVSVVHSRQFMRPTVLPQ